MGGNRLPQARAPLPPALNALAWAVALVLAVTMMGTTSLGIVLAAVILPAVLTWAVHAYAYLVAAALWYAAAGTTDTLSTNDTRREAAYAPGTTAPGHQAEYPSAVAPVMTR